MSQLEPYYHSDRVIIYWHDCRVIMPLLFEQVDCVIADPPYETSLAWDRRVTGWLPLAGRRAIGIEISQAHCDTAIRRLETLS